MGYKMKGTTLYGKPTGKGGFTNGDLTVSRTGNDNRADGRAKSSAFQKGTGLKGKLKAAWQTAKEVWSPEYGGGDISQNYKANKALIRKAKAEGGTPNFESMTVEKSKK
jgi:hypothetical protein